MIPVHFFLLALNSIIHELPHFHLRKLVLCGLWACLYACGHQGWCQVTTEEAVEPTRILFVFDASNSMNAMWGGQRKITTASELLSESLKSLHGSEGLELGLRVYGHGTKHVPGKQDCDDTELLVPFGTFNNLIIKQTLGKVRAQGTTPIARSLELAAGDFPDTPGRNVIVLITDGIEACDEDPCAVSRALQAKGIVVKPFVIGMGIEENLMASLSCIGNFYDASDPEAFEFILEMVLEQALHNTTFHLELLDGEGEPRVTNVPYSLTDMRTGKSNPHWVHTLRHQDFPDTLYVDPLPMYALTLHSLPGVVVDSITLKPGVHNVIRVPDMGQGKLRPQFARGVRTDYGNMHVDWFESGTCTPFFSSPIGDEILLRTGTYDVRFPTTPPTHVRNVKVDEDGQGTVEIPAPGMLFVQGHSPGHAVIVDQFTLDLVYKFPEGDITRNLPLQPGSYTLIYRSRMARGTLYSIHRDFQITSGSTTNVKLHE